MTMINLMQATCFGGTQSIYSHQAFTTNCTMRFGIYLPPQAKTTLVPALYWLSGLTCTEQNFITKAGAQRMASELSLALIIPDTSPRGLNLDEEKGSGEMVGEGAGFYLDATLPPWSKHYRMYSYITEELYALIAGHFPIDATRIGIFGHSMGGHGALALAINNPHLYRSVSAFAPISSLMQSSWGVKALQTYLGKESSTWRAYDVIELMATKGWKNSTILIDQGTQDNFLETQLKPHLLAEACRDANVSLQLRLQAGYDHSYYFISTFMADHLLFHAGYL